MFFSTPLLVVFKTTGGKAWNRASVGLKPLTKTQRQGRKESIEQTLKNISILKMAAAAEPRIPTRLRQPLPAAKAAWMRRKLTVAQELWARGGSSASAAQSLGWQEGEPASLRGGGAADSLSSAIIRLKAAFQQRMPMH